MTQGVLLESSTSRFSPEWVSKAIFYQIFPDRFARVDHRSGHLVFKPWGSDPAEQGFHGGNLKGIECKLDYLTEFGVNALYLNPIFSSASNHRYHTYDYFQVDPILGGNEDFRQLLVAAKQRNIKVMLDGVFNHASRGFWAFHHILENGAQSPYADWFHVQDWPLNPYPKEPDEHLNYVGWWNLPALPKFNTNHPDVREYLFSVAEYWAKEGIDGWRLDVPYEINDDSFWQEFRRRVKAINPEIYICGEIWESGSRWLKGDMFDATMNYPFTGAVLGWFGHKNLDLTFDKSSLDLTKNSSVDFMTRINKLTSSLSPEVLQSQFNLLDSHDTARALTIMGEDLIALKQALCFLFCFPGAPCIYYGTEIALEGRDDPDCRKSFPWTESGQYETDLRPFIKQLAVLRKTHSCFTHGEPELVVLNEHVVMLKLSIEGICQAMLIQNRSSHTFSVWQLPGFTVEGFTKAFSINSEYQDITAKSSQLWLLNNM